MVRAALVQFQSALRDVEENLERIGAIVEGTDADLVVFPEMALTGYSLRDDVYTLAQAQDGQVVGTLADIAVEGGRAMVVGMPVRSDVTGFVWNGAVAVSAGGKVAVYSKRRLINFGPFEERFLFKQGTMGTVLRVGGMRFGITICYDIFFPELAKDYAMGGVDGIINISASPTVTRTFFERVLPARAIENTVYTLYTNLVRTERGLVFWGGAQAHDPRGSLIARGPYFKEAVLSVDMDPVSLRVARPFRPTHTDTPPSGDPLPTLEIG